MRNYNSPRGPVFFSTARSPCAYIKGQFERRIVTELDSLTGSKLHSELSLLGFRRSHKSLYKPVCETCQECVAVRVLALNFKLSKSQKRIVSKNRDLSVFQVDPEASTEHFKVFSDYQASRHAGGGMSKMSFIQYKAMVEETEIDTQIVEFREPSGRLVSALLVDHVENGFSAVYSFFEPKLSKFGLGNFLIIQCLLYGKKNKYKYLYLGYYISKISSMSYKSRFKPGQILENNEWKNV